MKRYFEEIVQAINNSPNLKWKAKYNPFGMRSPIFDALFHEHSSKNIVVNKMIDKNFMNDIRKFHESNLMKEHIERLRNFPAQQLPDEFDARKKWPLCSTIHDVPNQGGCGSCFAIAAAGVASDRICIATNATVQVILSADDIISCCAGCGTCIGGDPLKVMIYWVNHGIVTGGPGGCRPYSYNIKCGVPCPLLEFVKNAKRQKCHQKCQKSYYWNDYINDKHYASIAYTMVPRVISLAGYGNIVVPAVTDYFNTKIINNVTKSFPAQETREILKKEIYLSGPITMAFPVAEEFLHYAKGIYSPYPENGFKNRIIYWHVVRIIGWGHDVDGTFYWIAINSYGRNWGEYGLFRIDTRFLEQFGLEYEAALV
uniref:Peptidase C1A papain C-terminal domain-containing protein n=1 Tax=Setaria digitata TaxID=48799 RepID=A0A915PFM9_9BILA